MSTPATKSKPTTPLTVKALGQLVRKAQGEEAPATGKPVFRITAATLDRHRDRMLPTALKVDNYNENPVVLWNHDDDEPAIGTARVYQEGDEWLAEVTFSEVTERARDVKGLVADGTLRTCSIGFIVHDYDWNDAGGYDYALVEMVELSITNIPAVREAQRVKNQTGKNGQPPEGAPPSEAVKAKSLEEGDVETIRTIMAEVMKPITEAMARLEAKLAETPAAEPPAEEKSEPPASEPPASEPPVEEKRATGARRGFLFVG